MNHHDIRGYYAAVPLEWLALCTMSTGLPVIRTTPEDTRILHFLVMGAKKKRIAIVAREIAEERNEREVRRTLTWAATG